MRLRRLALAVGLASTFGTQLASALGMGEIKLQSNLNQPLVAEIKLLQARDLTEDEILINLASKEEFQRAGVDRPYFLTELKFSVDLTATSGPVIRISSRKPVREPYLNFILESQWPNGRILREYTVLLDLPVFSDEAAAPVQSARSSTSKSTAAPSKPLAKAAPQQSVQSRRAGTAGEVYGPVSSSDTLWEIALKVRPNSSYSVHKTMLAIQRLNPEAFINGNINLLRRGQVLRVPSADDIGQFSQKQALNEVAFQNNQWSGDQDGQALGAQLDGAGRRQEATGSSSVVEGRLKVAGVEPVRDLQSGQGSSGSGVGGNSDSGALQNELSVSLEELDKTKRENNDLRTRVQDLEAQIKTMERLVEVSSQEMRALQLRANEDGEPAEAELSGGDAASADDAVAAAEGVKAASTASKSTTESVETPKVDPSKVVRSTKSDDGGWLGMITDNILYIGGAIVAILAAVLLLMRRREEDEQELDLTPVAEAAEQPPTALDEVQAEVVDEDFDALSDIADEEIFLADDLPVDDKKGGVKGSISTESQTGDAVGEADIYIAYGKLDQAEDMLLKAIVANGDDLAARLKLMEVYAEMNDLSKFDEQYGFIVVTGDEAAIAQADDLRLDFEDVPAQSGELADFDGSSATDDLEDGESFGLSLDPSLLDGLDDSGLVSEEFELDTSADELDLSVDLVLDETSLADDDEDFDIDLDLPQGGDATTAEDPDSVEDNAALELDLESEDSSFELDLDESLMADDSDSVLEVGEKSSFDMDMNSLELDEPEVEFALSESEGYSEPDDELGDEFEVELDLDLDDGEAFDLQDDAEVDLAALDEELGALSDKGLEEDLESELAETLEEDSDEDEMLDLDVGLDLDVDEELLTASAANLDEDDDEIFTAALADLPAHEDEDVLKAEEVTDEDMDAEFDFLADTDEIATKLDLARAYIDMGDHDGAKDILDEVVQEGDEDQRKDAEELMSRLG